MAVRNILTNDDPGLTMKSRIITDFDSRLHQLLDDMRDTLICANGAGIAAPQVGVLRRAILVVNSKRKAELMEELDRDDVSDMYYQDIVEMINPEIINTDGEQVGNEGCLSLPGQCGIVTRPLSVTVKAQDRYGDFFELTCRDHAARAVCHEINHLDGVLYTSLATRMLTAEEIEDLNLSTS